ncbi:AI-2E family transporter [Devosia sp. LjRoot16]|uniref:AI-2E family transporter n=1 Tax=Devosia sp. LjRoot16 TaxID=3342271 RepID=UPI003ED07900
MATPDNAPLPHKGGLPLETAAAAGFFLTLIVGLYLGQGIFVPLVLAVLLAFALSPVVAGLRRVGLPNVVATLVAVLGAGVMIALVGYLVVTQLLKLAGDLPQYQSTIAAKIRSFQMTAGSEDVFERLAQAAERLGEQTGLSGNKPGTEGNPLPVTIANVPPSPLASVQGLLGSLLGPLATGAIVTVLVIFLLLEREDLRDRFLRLVSRGDLRTSTKVLNESAQRVSRYLLVQFLVNAGYGVVFGAGLVLLGVPNAVLWGLFATLFRYIPFVGTLIAVTIPLTLAFAVDPGWTMLAGVILLYLVVELTTTNAIEPRLYGSSTGLSALAVLVAAIFWATLWGPIGLLLATPLTVCLVVIGRYVPNLAFLEILLGSEPVLTGEQRFYQRLLARNTEEAIDMASSEVAETDLPQFIDSIALPALRLAEADLQLDGSDMGPRRAIVETLSDVMDELAPSETMQSELPGAGKILVIGGRTELDAAAAEMLSALLKQAGVEVSQLPPMSARREGLGQIDLSGVNAVCLCYLGSSPKSFVRYAARRLKARSAETGILACLFNVASSDADFMPADLGVDAIARSMKGALTQALTLLGGADDAGSEAEPPSGVGQLEALRRLQRDTRYGGWLDDFLAKVAATFEVPLATASIIERADSSAEEPPPPANLDATSLYEQVGKQGSPLVIEDVAAHEHFRENPFLLENGIRFYAGVPLLPESGQPVGTLSIFDVAPRQFSVAQTESLQALAVELMSRVQTSAPADR